MSTESYASLTSAGCHNFVVPFLLTSNSVLLHNNGLTILDLHTCRYVKVVRGMTTKFVKKNKIRKKRRERSVEEERTRRRNRRRMKIRRRMQETE